MKSNVSANSSTKQVLKCSYCEKPYKTETGLVKHVCAQKRRFFEKDTPKARHAFHAFVRFHDVHFRGRKSTYDKFMSSQVYDAFLKFGSYILDIHAVDPKEYTEYMVRSGIPIDRWCRDETYKKYMGELTLKESPDRAFERSIILMTSWGAKQEKRWQDFFREVSTYQAADWITSGKLSPWVVLNCQSGHAMLARFSEEQMEMIKSALNIRFWNGKFGRHAEQVNDIQSALKDEGL